ncbi:MAG: hypothetical protein JNK87_15510 [Bryobacterales bacterium]|nr:hypothetical protein [Bryobacterales bacterium]
MHPAPAAWLVLLPALLPAAPPELAANGIRHAATQIPTSLPAARLAPGSRITLTGIRLSAPGLQTRVTLKAGTRAFPLTLLTGTPEMLEAILPMNAPPGPAILQVHTGQESSPAYPLALAPSAPGIFPLSAQQRGASLLVQVTGLGARPPRAFVGNLSVPTTIRRTIAPGLVELAIPIPPNAPTGCHVPIQLDTGTLPTNTITVPIAPCDSRHPITPSAEPGRTSGVVIRTDTVATGATDIWAGFFQLSDLRQAGPLLRLPPPGHCLAATIPADEDTPLSASLPSLLLRGQPRILNAGPHLNFFAGAQTLRIPAADGPVYQRKLPPPLPPGDLRLASQGSADLGPFSLKAAAPQRLASVRLPDANSRHSRAQPLTLQWEPAAKTAPHPVLAALTVRDAKLQIYGFVVCLADSSARTLTIPPRALAALPAANSSLSFATLPAETTPIPAAKLDRGVYVPAALYSTSLLLD